MYLNHFKNSEFKNDATCLIVYYNKLVIWTENSEHMAEINNDRLKNIL